ncbi:MAG: hypothetical protein NZO16_02780 [Deltaproteobacteria bacterium]|nr:hypothetical protein [Deltaproteobacteria bacterium]
MFVIDNVDQFMNQLYVFEEIFFVNGFEAFSFRMSSRSKLDYASEAFRG